MKKSVIVVFLLSFLTGCEWGYGSFEACMLENLKGTDSSIGFRTVYSYAKKECNRTCPLIMLGKRWEQVCPENPTGVWVGVECYRDCGAKVFGYSAKFIRQMIWVRLRWLHRFPPE